MRITENTASHLKLRDRTLWISAVCFAAAASLIARAAFDQDQFEQLIPAGLSLIFGLAFLRATDVTFDKIERVCAIRRFDVWRIIRRRLAFADITDVRVEIGPSPDDSAAISCRLSLVTASAVEPLTASYEPDQARFNAMRDAVLEVVFKDRRKPAALDPVRMLVKQGRIIDAVAILRMREGLDRTTASARVDQCQIDRERCSDQEGNGHLLHGRASGRDTKLQMPNIQTKFKLRRNRDRFAASLERVPDC
jgi:hypothetical protein